MAKRAEVAGVSYADLWVDTLTIGQAGTTVGTLAASKVVTADGSSTAGVASGVDAAIV